MNEVDAPIMIWALVSFFLGWIFGNWHRYYLMVRKRKKDDVFKQ